MFCPGTAILRDGRVVITGGSTSNVTTIYDPTDDSWTRGGDMHIGRGYHAMTMLSDGSLLTLGGSWGGVPLGDKRGEIWDYNTEQWTLKNGLDDAPMTTEDAVGLYRSDNHYW